MIKFNHRTHIKAITSGIISRQTYGLTTCRMNNHPIETIKISCPEAGTIPIHILSTGITSGYRD